jgi:hypothetical protein
MLNTRRSSSGSGVRSRWTAAAASGRRHRERGDDNPAADLPCADDLQQDDQRRDADRGEDEPAPVRRRRSDLGALVGDQPAGEHQPGHAERHVDEKDPPPRGVGAEQAAHRRRDDGCDQRRPGEVGDRPDEVGLLRRPEHGEPPDRHHQRAARSLEHPGGDQHRQARREGTSGGGNGEHDDRRAEHRRGAEARGEPAADRDQHRQGEHVRGDRHVDVDGGDAQVGGDVRRRRGDHRAVKDLHEQRARHQQRQPARDG